jgi:lichenan operon transcriptional antiterminator
MKNQKERQIGIIDEIAKDEGYVSSKTLSSMFGVSAKTVRKDIAEILASLQIHGIIVEKKQGKGYLMSKGNLEWNRCRDNFLQNKGKDDKNYRLHYLIQKFLSDNDFKKITQLSEELFVSPNVISAELKDVREVFNLYGISLEIVPWKGIRAVGKEQFFRSCMIQEFLSSDSFDEKSSEYEKFKNFFYIGNKNNVAFVEKTIKFFFANPDDKPFFLSEKDLSEIAIAVRMAINSNIRKNDMDFFPQETYETQLTRTFAITRKMFDVISQKFKKSFSENEVLYLANFILAHRTFLHFNEVTVKQNYYTALDSVNKILDEIMLQYGVKQYEYDRDTKERLALYMLALRARVNIHVIIEEQVIHNAAKYSIPAMQFAVSAAKILEKYYSTVLFHTEIERLALLFLPTITAIKLDVPKELKVVVISKRYPRDIAQMIVELDFKKCAGNENVEIDSFESYHAARAVKESGADLIITDVPNKMFAGYDKTIIQYSFNFSEYDSAQIKQWLNQTDKKWAKISSILYRGIQKTECQALDFKQAINAMSSCQNMSEQQKQDLEIDLLQGRRYGSILINNGIAFYKTINNYKKDSFLSVYKFSKQFKIDKEKVQMFFLLSCGNKNTSDILLFKDWARKIMANRECTKKLLESNADNLEQILKEHFFNE